MPPKPTIRDKLDECSIQANLQSILDRIDDTARIEPQVETFEGVPAYFPEVRLAEYFMGNATFDPAYYSRSLFPGRQPDELQLIDRYGYASMLGNKRFLHKLFVRRDLTRPEGIEHHWKFRAAAAREAWQDAKSIIDQLDMRILQIGALEQVLGPHFEQLCDRWMAEVVSEILLEDPELLVLHPLKDDVKEMTRNQPATMPRNNRPDVERFSEDNIRCDFHSVHERSRENSASHPVFKSRFPNQDTSVHSVYTESRTRSLRYHAHFWAPILNMENLRQPGFLASFIYNRGAHHPALFASRDFKSSYIGRAGRMDDTFHWCWTPDFWEFREDDQYIHPINGIVNGQPWEASLVKAVGAKGRLYSHLEAGAVVHSQRIIYGFLRKLVFHILQGIAKLRYEHQDVDPSIYRPNFGNDPQGTERLINQLLKSDSDKLESESLSNKQLTHIWATAQYAAPEETLFDFEECENLMLYMRDKARDKLNNLMTDPEVFLIEAKQILDHHPSQVKPTGLQQKTRHFDTEKVQKLGKAEATRLEDELSACVLHRMVLTAVRDLEVWEHLYTVAGRLGEHIRTEHIDLTDPETLLTDELRQLWLLLLHSLRAGFRHYYRDFTRNNPFLSSPPIRDKATRDLKAKMSARVDGKRTDMEPGWSDFVDTSTREALQYRQNKYTETERKKLAASTEWKKDDCALYCPDSKLLTRYHLWFDADQKELEDMSEADRIKRLLYWCLPYTQNLTYVGMSNIAEYLAKVDADLKPRDRMITPYVWNHISKLSVLSRLVDGMERTRRILPPQSHRLRQEFEEDYGQLSKYVFGPGEYLHKMAAKMFLPAKLRNGCKPLKGLLYPLLMRIDKGEDVDKGKGVDREQDVDMDRVDDDDYVANDDDGGLTFYTKGWSKVMGPENRKKELELIWRQALSGIIGERINELFATSNNKFNKGIKKMTKDINEGEYGIGIARFLSTFDTGRSKELTEAQLSYFREEQEKQEIEDLIDRIERDSENLERLTKEAEDETTQGAGSTANTRAASRPPRVRNANSKYRKNLRQQQAQQRGRRGQPLIQPAGAPSIVREPLAAHHWEAFAGTLGVRFHGSVPRTDFNAIKAAMGAIGYSMESARGSAVKFSWTAQSNLPPAFGRNSFETHGLHGSALENVKLSMLRIGRRLPTAGVTRKRLVQYYKGAPDGWPGAPRGG